MAMNYIRLWIFRSRNKEKVEERIRLRGAKLSFGFFFFLMLRKAWMVMTELKLKTLQTFNYSRPQKGRHIAMQPY